MRVGDRFGFVRESRDEGSSGSVRALSEFSQGVIQRGEDGREAWMIEVSTWPHLEGCELEIECLEGIGTAQALQPDGLVISTVVVSRVNINHGFQPFHVVELGTGQR